MSDAEKKLLGALKWLLRVSLVGACDGDELTAAYENAEELVAEYSAADKEKEET